MKRLNPLYAALLAATAAGMISTTASAATADGNFTVSVNVNPSCVVSTSGTRILFTVTGAGAGSVVAVTGNPDFTATCTNQVLYQLSITTGSESSGVYSYTGGAGGTGIFELAYSLTLRSGPFSSGGATVPSSTFNTATGTAQSYNLLAAMASGQTVTCAGGSPCATNVTKTIQASF